MTGALMLTELLASLIPGRYRMVVRMLGYRAIRERLDVEPGTSIRRDFRMTPTPPME
jgi:hypothetical protein